MARLDPLGHARGDLDAARRGCAPRRGRRRRSSRRAASSGWISSQSRSIELEVAGAPRHRAGVVVLQPPAGDEDRAGSRRRRRRPAPCRAARRSARARPARWNSSLVEDRRVGAVGGDRPLQAACGRAARSVTPANSGVSAAISSITSSGVSRPISWPSARETVERMSKSVARRPGGSIAALDELDAPLGVRERARLLEERRGRAGSRRRTSWSRSRRCPGRRGARATRAPPRRASVFGSVCATSSPKMYIAFSVAGDRGVEHLRDLQPGLARQRRRPSAASNARAISSSSTGR